MGGFLGENIPVFGCLYGPTRILGGAVRLSCAHSAHTVLGSEFTRAVPHPRRINAGLFSRRWRQPQRFRMWLS